MRSSLKATAWSCSTRRRSSSWMRPGCASSSRAHSQLLMTGHRLVVRAPTDVLTKLLQISRVAELVWVEPALIGATPRSPERVVDGDGRPVSSFVRAHAIPAGLDVVDAALLLVAELARSTIGAADGVSVSLRRHGHITTVAASDETIVEMDRHQYETGQGPCLSAAGEGTPFHVPSVEDEQRWPAFTPEALAQGIKSILSNPLLAESGPVGALNMYSRTRWGLRRTRPAVGCAVRTACV